MYIYIIYKCIYIYIYVYTYLYIYMCICVYIQPLPLERRLGKYILRCGAPSPGKILRPLK